MGILSLLIANENGLPLYSKNLSNREIDDSLFVAFFSALKIFAATFLRQEGQLKSVRLGAYSFDFFSTEFEELGTLDLLMISEGLDPTTAQATITEIGEKFALYIEQNNINIPEKLSQGVYLHLDEFDPIMMQVAHACQTDDMISLDVRWNVPKKHYNLVNAMFKINKNLGTSYENSESLFFEQLLAEYTEKSLENDIKRHIKYAPKDKSP